jgi:hypothetical protein
MPYYGESVKRERIDKFFSDLLTGGTFFLAGYVLEVTLRNASDGFGWTRKIACCVTPHGYREQAATHSIVKTFRPSTLYHLLEPTLRSMLLRTPDV